MARNSPAVGFAAVVLLVLSSGISPGFAQKSGGILRVHHQDSPASMSILEEATYSTVVPMMGVFNNLVLYKQDEPQNSMKSIVPDLATSWSWSEDGTELTFKLRQGVKWHDGKPFAAADVKCTYDLLLGKAKEKLRINPRKAWFRNLEEVTADSMARQPFICTGRNPPLSRCSRPAIRRFTRAMFRRARCAPTRSAPGPSNLSRSKQTSRSGSSAIRITGNQAGPISMASSTRSFRTGRPRSWLSSPASST
jgi:hypothetical protein